MQVLDANATLAVVERESHHITTDSISMHKALTDTSELVCVCVGGVSALQLEQEENTDQHVRNVPRDFVAGFDRSQDGRKGREMPRH
jgi:hypothetical protein